MGEIAVGSVVFVLFPFSNLKGQKVRPALVLAKVEFGNLILCQITSKPYTSKSSIQLNPSDFKSGGLPIVSFVGPDKMFTAERTIIKSVAGNINRETRAKILKKARSLFSG